MTNIPREPEMPLDEPEWNNKLFIRLAFFIFCLLSFCAFLWLILLGLWTLVTWLCGG